MPKRPRCAYCKRAFTPPKRGRPPKYCCDAHRQAAWVRRLQHRELPTLLLGQDIADYRTKAGIERAVIDVLRQLGFVAPSPSAPTPLRLVKADKEKGGQ